MFNNTSIKLRLIVALALLSVIMLIIGVMGLASLSHANAALKTVYEDRLVAVAQLDQVIRSINRTQLAVTESSNSEPAQLPGLASKIETEIAMTNQVWGSVFGHLS